LRSLSGFTLLLTFLDPGPGVAQRGRSIKDELPGGLAGIQLATKIPDGILRKIFGVVLLAASLKMIFFK